MLKHRTVFLLIVLCTAPIFTNSQSNWQLAKQTEGIRIFLKNAETGSIKMLRAECDIHAKPEAILALLMDVQASEKWIPQTKQLRILKRFSSTEFLYYSELNLPWPVSNRDFIVRLKASQHATTKVITVDAYAVSGELPEYNGIVRVKSSLVKWVLYPATAGHTRLVYEIYTDPGGNLPISLVNYFAREAAIDIVKKLQKLVQKQPYTNAVSPF